MRMRQENHSCWFVVFLRDFLSLLLMIFLSLHSVMVAAAVVLLLLLLPLLLLFLLLSLLLILLSLWRPSSLFDAVVSGAAVAVI